MPPTLLVLGLAVLVGASRAVLSILITFIDDGLVVQEGPAKDLIPITRNNSFKIA